VISRFHSESRELVVHWELPRQDVIPKVVSYRYRTREKDFRAEPRKDAEIAPDLLSSVPTGLDTRATLMLRRSRAALRHPVGRRWPPLVAMRRAGSLYDGDYK
jgi:hypothetical protein